jgi:ligand-binding sensor protein
MTTNVKPLLKDCPFCQGLGRTPQGKLCEGVDHCGGSGKVEVKAEDTIGDRDRQKQDASFCPECGCYC